MPSVVSDMAFGGSPFQFLWNTEVERVFIAKEKRHILPKSFRPFVSIELLGSRIPCRNASADIQQEERVVLQPVGVCDRNRCTGMDDNCPEQLLKFFWTVFHQPTSGLRLRGYGAHRFPPSPVDPEAGTRLTTLHPVSTTLHPVST